MRTGLLYVGPLRSRSRSGDALDLDLRPALDWCSPSRSTQSALTPVLWSRFARSVAMAACTPTFPNRRGPCCSAVFGSINAPRTRSQRAKVVRIVGKIFLISLNVNVSRCVYV